MTFIIKNWKYLLPALILIVCIAYNSWSNNKAYKSGFAKASEQCKLEKLQADKKGRDTYDKIQKDITGLADPDLDKRLQPWYRD